MAVGVVAQMGGDEHQREEVAAGGVVLDDVVPVVVELVEGGGVLAVAFLGALAVYAAAEDAEEAVLRVVHDVRVGDGGGGSFEGKDVVATNVGQPEQHGAGKEIDAEGEADTVAGVSHLEHAGLFTAEGGGVEHHLVVLLHAFGVGKYLEAVAEEDARVDELAHHDVVSGDVIAVAVLVVLQAATHVFVPVAGCEGLEFFLVGTDENKLAKGGTYLVVGFHNGLAARVGGGIISGGGVGHTALEELIGDEELEGCLALCHAGGVLFLQPLLHHLGLQMGHHIPQLFLVFGGSCGGGGCFISDTSVGGGCQGGGNRYFGCALRSFAVGDDVAWNGGHHVAFQRWICGVTYQRNVHSSPLFEQNVMFELNILFSVGCVMLCCLF